MADGADRTDGGPDARPRVLVVEDDALNQRLAQRMLGHLGYDVDLAGSGREALEALALRPYAAVLMDGHLPEMDGFATTRELRAREGDGTRTPVIAVSGATLDEDRAKARDAGMDDYLDKPLELDRLRACLARWISAAGG